MTPKANQEIGVFIPAEYSRERRKKNAENGQRHRSEKDRWEGMEEEAKERRNIEWKRKRGTRLCYETL